MATVSQRLITNQEIQEELQLITQEIPLEYLQHCIEEHYCEISKVECLLQENRQRNLQQPDVKPSNSYTMDRRSVSPQPSQRQGRSVSEDNSIRGMADGRISSPSLKRERQNPVGPRHQKSNTWNEHYLVLPRDNEPLHVDINCERSSGFPPRHSPKRADVGVWLSPTPPTNEISVVNINVSKPTLQHSPVSNESSSPSLMTTQQISPMIVPTTKSTSISNSPSVNQESNAKAPYSPFFPWTETQNSPNRSCVYPVGEKDMHKSNQTPCPVSFQPLQTAEETTSANSWSQEKHTSPKSPPTVITSISSPVAPPVVSITNWEDSKHHGATESSRSIATVDEQNGSNPQRSNIGSEIKKQTRLQALLAHQKARFELIKRRVEETRLKTETVRKEVADMENDLDRRRGHTHSSFPTPEAISRLREEKQDLQTDVDCLQRDITLCHAAQRENSSQNSFDFYQHISDEPCHPTYGSLPLPVIPNVSSAVERDSNSQWSCRTCSFKNHEYMPECEICGKPRREPVMIQSQLADGDQESFL